MNHEKNLNALEVVIIACVLFGAFFLQLVKHEIPCPLCLLQRLGMIGVAAGALLNVKFGPYKRHYGLSLLFAVLGGFIALRQIALHVCPGTPKFGVPFLGISLYTWSFILFVCTVFYNGLLLIAFDQKKKESVYMNLWGHFAFALIFIAAFGNVITTFLQCGWSVCQDVL